MKHISLPESIEEIPQGCFRESGLEEIAIPRKVKKIIGAFEGCWNLRSVVFEHGSELAEIGNWAFSGCKSLKSICLPDNLRKIGTNVFNGCDNLVLTLPEGLTSIGEKWFKGSGIKEVHIPASVQSIGEGSFKECKNLQKVTFAEGS